MSIISNQKIGLAVAVLLLGAIRFSASALAGVYADSAHGDSAQGVAKRASGGGVDYAVGNCGHCHDQHASREATTHTPYNALSALSEEILCLDCHDGIPPAGSTATDNIATLVAKTYSHPVSSAGYAGRHTISQTLEIGKSGTPFQGAKRHVECCDCHDPHTIGDTETNHALKTNLTAGSDPLIGVWGVEPTTEAIWTPPAAYTDTNPATKEYQICFKCHSMYAFQDADGITGVTGPSGTALTDQAMEFATGNKSVHPVRVGLNSQTGSSARKALVASQMSASWNSVGTQTMYCSDCHGSDSSTATAAGPHGSSNIYMLKGEASNNYAFWPTDNASGTGGYFTLEQVVEDAASYRDKILCKKCHPFFPGGVYTEKQTGGFYNYVHDKHYDKGFNGTYGGFSGNGNIPCVACHTPIPHGSRRGRLIGYNGDPPPYKITIGTDTFPVISGFKKPTSATPGNGNGTTTGYDDVNCYINSSICGHHSNDGGYDL